VVCQKVLFYNVLLLILWISLLFSPTKKTCGKFKKNLPLENSKGSFILNYTLFVKFYRCNRKKDLYSLGIIKERRRQWIE